jgi:hypothetical protein
MAHSLVSPLTHPHLNRRRWLEGSSTWFLVALSQACLRLYLPHLERLVEEVLHQRFREEPAVAPDPELERLLPY